MKEDGFIVKNVDNELMHQNLQQIHGCVEICQNALMLKLVL